jgi:hypothetical protein
MNRVSTSLVLLLAGTFALAQTSSTSGKTPATLVLPMSNSDCPIGFFASRQANLQIMTASEAAQAGPAQGLHLTLTNPNPHAIQSVEVTVYGSSLKRRLLPVDQQADTVSKTFELQRKTGSDSLSDADVWMHNTGSLTSVDLISITYADGTTWHAAGSPACHAIPSNFLLVGSK